MSDEQRDIWGPIGSPGRDIKVPTADRRSPNTAHGGIQVPSVAGADAFAPIEGKSLKGVGPSGYARTDDRIRHVIEEKLADDSTLDPSGVEISVKDGEVTLGGSVKGIRARYAVCAIAQSIGGVTKVHDRLTFPQEP